MLIPFIKICEIQSSSKHFTKSMFHYEMNEAFPEDIVSGLMHWRQKCRKIRLFEYLVAEDVIDEVEEREMPIGTKILIVIDMLAHRLK